MKLDKILEAAAKAFAGVKPGGRKGDPELAELDRGVLTVGLLLAALDGTVLPEEYAAFRTLAKRCRGGSAKNVRALLDAALPAAGRLMAMAQVGVYSEKERLAAFLSAAAKALPCGFANGSMADLRRAFALWVTMGISDGEFSAVEKSAVTALERHYAVARAKDSRRGSSPEGRGRDVPVASEKEEASISRRDEDVASTGHGKRSLKPNFRLLEPDFLKKAEKIARDLAVPAKKAKAEAALDGLIASVPTVDGKGKPVVLPANGIALKLAAMAMIGLATTI